MEILFVITDQFHFFPQYQKCLKKLCVTNCKSDGFRKNHSTEFAALELIYLILEDMDKGKIPIGIFIDLSKASDLINDQILTKLYHYGIYGSPLQLI